LGKFGSALITADKISKGGGGGDGRYDYADDDGNNASSALQLGCDWFGWAPRGEKFGCGETDRYRLK